MVAAQNRLAGHRVVGDRHDDVQVGRPQDGDGWDALHGASMTLAPPSDGYLMATGATGLPTAPRNGSGVAARKNS